MFDEENIRGAFCLKSNGDVIEKIENFMPDVVILDLHMPDVDGVELYRIIRKNPKLTHIPVVALSATEDVLDRIRLIEAGFNQFILKPVDKEKLLNVIETQINLSKVLTATKKALEVMEDY